MSKFIVFDGMDGCGKGTQVKLLAEEIFSRDKKNHLFLTREPYKSIYYDEIRALLKSGIDPKDNAEKMAELFVKDREVHCVLIKKLLDDGVWVISDRYKYSTLAYQQTQGIELQKLIEMHNKPEILVPDLAIIIDVTAEVALGRIEVDGDRSHKEVFEKLDFQEELRKKFVELPDNLPNENIKIINGGQTTKEVFEDIKKEVEKLLV